MPNTKEHLASTRWAGTLGVVLHVVSHWLSNFLCVHVFWVLLSPNYLCWPQWQCSYATHPGMPTPMPLILACLLLCHSSWHAYSYATHPGMPTPMPLILACLLLCHSSWHAYYATHPGMPTWAPSHIPGSFCIVASHQRSTGGDVRLLMGCHPK